MWDRKVNVRSNRTEGARYVVRYGESPPEVLSESNRRGVDLTWQERPPSISDIPVRSLEVRHLFWEQVHVRSIRTELR